MISGSNVLPGDGEKERLPSPNTDRRERERGGIMIHGRCLEELNLSKEARLAAPNRG